MGETEHEALLRLAKAVEESCAGCAWRDDIPAWRAFCALPESVKRVLPECSGYRREEKRGKRGP